MAEREHRLTAANCELSKDKGYPISTGNVCFACREQETQMSAGPEFDCIDCLARAEDAAEAAMLGWDGVKDYYAEFRANCPEILNEGKT